MSADFEHTQPCDCVFCKFQREIEKDTGLVESLSEDYYCGSNYCDDPVCKQDHGELL